MNRPNQPKHITMPLFESVFLPAWLTAFAPRETPPATAPTSGLARGEYLVRSVGHCGECQGTGNKPDGTWSAGSWVR